MSDYPYDPTFPIVAVNVLGFGVARLTCLNHVKAYFPNCIAVDTTPKEEQSYERTH